MWDCQLHILSKRPRALSLSVTFSLHTHTPLDILPKMKPHREDDNRVFCDLPMRTRCRGGMRKRHKDGTKCFNVATTTTQGIHSVCITIMSLHVEGHWIGQAIWSEVFFCKKKTNKNFLPFLALDLLVTSRKWGAGSTVQSRATVTSTQTSLLPPPPHTHHNVSHYSWHKDIEGHPRCQQTH